jgi:predicted DNA-binding transcriptional regulator AlpA
MFRLLGGDVPVASEWLTAADMEELTGVAESTWRHFGLTGQGPQSIKVGRRRLWRRSTVEAWLAEQEAARA